MMYPWEFPYCQICGMRIFPHYRDYQNIGPRNWDPKGEEWLQNAITLYGPHLVPGDDYGPNIFPGGPISRHASTAAGYQTACLRLLPSERIVDPWTGKYTDIPTPVHYDLDFVENYPDRKNWYIGVHDACDELAKRVMQTSSTSQIRPPRDIWVTILQRWEWGFPFYHQCMIPDYYLAYIPQRLPDGRFKKSMAGYYAPSCFGEDPEGWWQKDPIHIPGLTESLMSNLQHAEDAETESSNFQILFLELPPELRDQIVSLLTSGSAALECNYMIPQSYWMQAFLRTPHLWDLDRKVIEDVLSSSNTEGREWNWEKLTRQVMAGPTALPLHDVRENEHWKYKDVGLDIPEGLTNRRRIWQVLDDMDPDELVNQCEYWNDDMEADQELDKKALDWEPLPVA